MSIYRLPPMVIGTNPIRASEIKDKMDWGLKALGIPSHWAETSGKGIRVGVCDTGRYEHPDIAPPVLSKNFSASNTDKDLDGHATHVCGTLAAKKDGIGMVGMAPDVEIVTCKVLGDDGSGSYEAIVAGIDYCVEHGCDIISMSLGGPWDRDLRLACQRAHREGIFLICAAGNEGSQGVTYPAKLPWTIAVAAYNDQGKIARFSSRGPQVDVAFPGEDIFSTWLDGKYNTISGTSMATPSCAGLVALMLSAHKVAEGRNIPVTPITNNDELREHIQRHAVDQGPRGKDKEWGWGIPDVDGFLHGNIHAPVPPPSPEQPTDQPISVPPADIIRLESGLSVVLNACWGGLDGVFIYPTDQEEE